MNEVKSYKEDFGYFPKLTKCCNADFVQYLSFDGSGSEKCTECGSENLIDIGCLEIIYTGN